MRSVKNTIGMAVLCDFDETVAMENVAHLLLNEYANIDLESLKFQFDQGMILPIDYFELPFEKVKANRIEMQEYVRRNAHLRHGFKELVLHCENEGVEIAIVTHGLDFYVEALIRSIDIPNIPIYASRANFTRRGIEYEYLYTNDNCRQWGNCKCSIVERYKEKYDQVIYVGDGVSDFCPAKRADVIFARGQLLEICNKEDVSCNELDDFNDVINQLNQYMEGSI